MKIIYHDFQLNYRGSSLSTYNYAKYNQEILGNESVIVSTSSRPNEMQLLEKCKTLCKVVLYPEIWNDRDNSHLRLALEKIVEEEKADIFYAQKGGENDGILPRNCKTIAHYVFRGDQPHGDAYVGISEYLAKKHGRHDFIPYIVERNEDSHNCRDLIGADNSDLVIGCLGGKESFSVDFVRASIIPMLNARSDLWFVFIGMNFPASHSRIINYPVTTNSFEKFNLIKSCDAMLHARRDGETFGLACAEFSICNKPVITYDCYDHWYDRAHIDMLGAKCMLYSRRSELEKIILNLDRNYIVQKDWNAYKNFSADKVMGIFKKYL